MTSQLNSQVTHDINSNTNHTIKFKPINNNQVYYGINNNINNGRGNNNNKNISHNNNNSNNNNNDNGNNKVRCQIHYKGNINN